MKPCQTFYRRKSIPFGRGKGRNNGLVMYVFGSFGTKYVVALIDNVNDYLTLHVMGKLVVKTQETMVVDI